MTIQRLHYWCGLHHVIRAVKTVQNNYTPLSSVIFALLVRAEVQQDNLCRQRPLMS